MATYDILDYKDNNTKVGSTITYTAQPINGGDEVAHDGKIYVVRYVRNRPDSDSVIPDVELICYEKGTNDINYTVV